MSVKIGKTLSTPRNVPGGSPQGSILGNYLFCATTDCFTGLDGEDNSGLNSTQGDEALMDEYIREINDFDASSPVREDSALWEDDEIGSLEGFDVGSVERVGGLDGRSCLLYTSPSPRDLSTSRMPSSA